MELGWLLINLMLEIVKWFFLSYPILAFFPLYVYNNYNIVQQAKGAHLAIITQAPITKLFYDSHL
jgi:hypothetical protein